MKKYLTLHNIALAVLFLGVVILAVVIFVHHKSTASLTDLQAIEKREDSLSKALQAADVKNEKRDSTMQATFEKKSAERQTQVVIYKQSSDENVQHINSDSFNADSIRRSFANN